MSLLGCDTNGEHVVTVVVSVALSSSVQGSGEAVPVGVVAIAGPVARLGFAGELSGEVVGIICGHPTLSLGHYLARGVVGQGAHQAQV